MKKKISIPIIAILIIIVLAVVIVKKNSNKTNNEIANNETTNIASSENINSDEDEVSNDDEYFILYNGIEIQIGTGTQGVIEGMDIENDNEEKYNTTYYNFEDGEYVGTTEGSFSSETVTYDGIGFVDNVSKFAISKYYDAVPYEYTKVSELPEELSYLEDYTSYDIEEIDLDGNGESEYIVCYTIEKSGDETEDGEPAASSYIMLFDSNHEKIADLVSLENGYWANIKEEEQKILLSLERDVEYIDIDNDGIMEIVIDVPQYEGSTISIVKYDNGTLSGETDIEADLTA